MPLVFLAAPFTPVTALTAGQTDSAAVLGGTVYSAGRNVNGQLGLGNTTLTNTWTSTGFSASFGSQGGFHTAMVKNDGSLWTCGSDSQGQLSQASTSTQQTSFVDTSETGVTVVAAGYEHTLAIMGGTVWACGNSNYGETGLGTGDRNVFENTSVVASAVATGLENSSYAVSAGSMYVCGRNNDGCLGIGSNALQGPTTFTLSASAPTNCIGVTGGYRSAMLWTDDGKLYGVGRGLAWGGTTANTWQDTGMTNVTWATAGRDYGYCISGGTLYVTGTNIYGTTAQGTTSGSISGWQSTGITGVTAIEASWYHVLMIRNGNLWVVGQNDYGQLGLGDTSNRTNWVDTGLSS